MPEVNWISEYNKAINDGQIVAGKWIHLLMNSLVSQLREGTLVYDAEKANHAIDWIQAHAFHTEGPLAPQPLRLELWQKAFVSSIFGLCNPETGVRQFREIVMVVARKNGKSLLTSAILRYVFENGGFGSRVYCLAPKLEQADIIYNSIWQMVQLDPEWQKLKEAIQLSKDEHNKKTIDDSGLIRHRQSDLFLPATNSTVKKLAFTAKRLDGFNPSIIAEDEFSSYEGEAGLRVHEVMKSAMGAREMGDNPSILLACSTSGYVNDSIYDELIGRSTRYLMGDSKETKLLPWLYMIDDINAWNDIQELKKSNPNLGVSVSESYLIEEANVAAGSLSKKAEFIVKYCNIKQNASTAWLDAQTVDAAFGDGFDLEDFRGCYCVGGIDLSQTTDLTSCCVVVEKGGKLYVISKFFMPAGRVETGTAEDGVPYDIFAKQGLLTLSGENFVDYHDCFEWFKSLVQDYEIYPLQIGYDRYSAQYLVEDLKQYGFHMDDVYQGTNLSPVIREFEGMLKDGSIRIGTNNLLKSHLLNSALKVDAESQRCRLVKLGTRTRIDGTAALLDAMCVRQKWCAEIGEQLRNEG